MFRGDALPPFSVDKKPTRPWVKDANQTSNVRLTWNR